MVKMQGKPKGRVKSSELKQVDLLNEDFFVIRDPKTDLYYMAENPDTKDMQILTFVSEEKAEEFMQIYNIDPNCEIKFIAKRPMN